MPGRLNEEEAAMDTSVLNVFVALGREFLSEIRRMLILNVLDDWIPAKNKSGGAH